eukprot:Clim_evm31s204 gene=Clim_evmTU31s204
MSDLKRLNTNTEARTPKSGNFASPRTGSERKRVWSGRKDSSGPFANRLAMVDHPGQTPLNASHEGLIDPMSAAPRRHGIPRHRKASAGSYLNQSSVSATGIAGSVGTATPTVSSFSADLLHALSPKRATDTATVAATPGSVTSQPRHQPRSRRRSQSRTSIQSTEDAMAVRPRKRLESNVSDEAPGILPIGGSTFLRESVATNTSENAIQFTWKDENGNENDNPPENGKLPSPRKHNKTTSPKKSQQGSKHQSADASPRKRGATGKLKSKDLKHPRPHHRKDRHEDGDDNDYIEDNDDVSALRIHDPFRIPGIDPPPHIGDRITEESCSDFFHPYTGLTDCRTYWLKVAVAMYPQFCRVYTVVFLGPKILNGEVFRQPITTLRQIIPKIMRSGLFLTISSVGHGAARCALRSTLGKHHLQSEFAAGFISSLAASTVETAQRKEALSLYMWNNSLDMWFSHLVRIGWLPRVPHAPELMFAGAWAALSALWVSGDKSKIDTLRGLPQFALGLLYGQDPMKLTQPGSAATARSTILKRAGRTAAAMLAVRVAYGILIALVYNRRKRSKKIGGFRRNPLLDNSAITDGPLAGDSNVNTSNMLNTSQHQSTFGNRGRDHDQSFESAREPIVSPTGPAAGLRTPLVGKGPRLGVMAGEEDADVVDDSSLEAGEDAVDAVSSTQSGYKIEHLVYRALGMKRSGGGESTLQRILQAILRIDNIRPAVFVFLLSAGGPLITALLNRRRSGAEALTQTAFAASAGLAAFAASSVWRQRDIQFYAAINALATLAKILLHRAGYKRFPVGTTEVLMALAQGTLWYHVWYFPEDVRDSQLRFFSNLATRYTPMSVEAGARDYEARMKLRREWGK